MNHRTYPYQAWVLLPSCKPKEVTVVGREYEGYYDEWDKEASGKAHHIDGLHASKAAAITAGWAKVGASEARITKMQTTVQKQRAALEKAAKETT